MSSQSQNPRRDLTQGEAFILSQVQEMYGYQNSEDCVFFSDKDEAVLFVTDRNGVSGIAVVLTNLAYMYENGTITSLEELRTKWLIPR